MNDCEFIEELTAFAESANIDTDDIPLLLTLRIVASFSQINAMAVLQNVLNSGIGVCNPVESSKDICVQDIDWNTISTRLNSDQYVTPRFLSSFWLRCMEFIAFVNEPPLSGEIEQYMLKLKNNMHAQIPTSFSPIDAVRIALMKTCGCEVEWTNLCRTFILLNVIQDDPASVITNFFKKIGITTKSEQDDAGVQMGRHLMGVRNTAAENQETLTGLLTSYIHIDSSAISELFKKRESEKLKLHVGTQAKFAMHQRPSLTEMVGNAGGRKGHGELHDSDSFQTFSTNCKFPLHMTIAMQRYIYFLKAMDESHVEANVLPSRIRLAISCPILHENITNTRITQVDTATITRVIQDCRHTGEPSADLKRFRRECVEPFFSSSVNREFLNWTVILRLYLAAYQRPAIRQQCWVNVLRRVHQVLVDESANSETGNAVVKFVESNPLDEGVFKHLERVVCK